MNLKQIWTIQFNRSWTDKTSRKRKKDKRPSNEWLIKTQDCWTAWEIIQFTKKNIWKQVHLDCFPSLMSEIKKTMTVTNLYKGDRMCITCSFYIKGLNYFKKLEILLDYYKTKANKWRWVKFVIKQTGLITYLTKRA